MMRHLTQLLVPAALLLLPFSTQAQLNTLYGFTQTAGTFTPITGGQVLAQTTFDDAVVQIDVPTFFFNGSYYSALQVSTNGFMTVGDAPATTNYLPISTTATYQGAISPFGTNLLNASSGTPEIRYQQVGNEIVVQWQDVKRATAGTERFSFQARIDAATGTIVFVYSAVTALNSVSVNQPQVGLRGPNTNTNQIKNRRVATGTETWLTSLAGTAAANTMRFTSTAPAKSPAGGETYTFAPTCLSPVATATTASECATNSFTVSVTVTSLGTGTAVNIASSTLGTHFSNVGLGTYVCGPFTLGTPVTITVAHSTNAGCTNTIGTFSPTPTCASVVNGDCIADPYITIPDFGCATGNDLQAVIPVSGYTANLGTAAGTTLLQYVEFIIGHTYRGDLRIRLTSPSGQTRDLLIQEPSPTADGSNFGSPGACPGLVLQLRDDAANPVSALPPSSPNATGAYRPEQPLSGFTGSPNGNWVLRICDNSVEDIGTLQYIRLRFRKLDCAGVPDGTAQPGTACNDNNICTSGDAYNANCVCTGTIGTDSDGDGTCNLLDGCPNDPNKIAPGTCGCGNPDPGTACNDGNACTINDVIQANCSCAGSFQDTDGDGTCNANDGCPNDPNKIAPGTCGCGNPDPGSACNDGNPNTVNDVIQANCTCAGSASTNLLVAVKVLLEGPYAAGTGLMNDNLRSAGLVPLSEPYAGLGFTIVGSGGEVTTAPVLSVTGNDAIVDWVFVQLRSSANSSTVLATRSGLLQRDGDIVDVDGTSALKFRNLAAGSYYVSVRHRNHLGVMTLNTVALSTTATTIDFRALASANYGTNAQKSLADFKVMWAGNVVRNGLLSYTGASNDRDPILVRVGSTTPNNVATGYYVEDVNMTGTVSYTGASNDRDPILVNVGSTTPNNTRVEQLP